MADNWKEAVEFAKEQEFDVKQDHILFPLGKLGDMEYGICTEYNTDNGKFYTKAYFLENDDVIFGDCISCYTTAMVVRTAEVGDKNYTIEKKVKEEEGRTVINDTRDLIWALKFKDLGTLGPVFLSRAYDALLFWLPQDLSEELINSKFSELDEKLQEVESLASELPESNKVIKNILNEFLAYTQAAESNGIKLNDTYLHLIEKAWKNTPTLLDLEKLARVLPKAMAKKLFFKTIDAYYAMEKKYPSKASSQPSGYFKLYVETGYRIGISLPPHLLSLIGKEDDLLK